MAATEVLLYHEDVREGSTKLGDFDVYYSYERVNADMVYYVIIKYAAGSHYWTQTLEATFNGVTKSKSITMHNYSQDTLGPFNITIPGGQSGTTVPASTSFWGTTHPFSAVVSPGGETAPAIKVRSGGSWVNASDFKVRSGGSWVKPSVKVKTAQGWKEI